MRQLLGYPILDTCPDCGRSVDPQSRQEIVWNEERKQFGRRCGPCIEKATKEGDRLPTSVTDGMADNVRQ